MDFDFLKNDKNIINNGVSEEELASVQHELSVKFPKELLDFLTFSDGAFLSERAIFFSVKKDAKKHEDFLSFNNSETVRKFLSIGRFNSDEFGYKAQDLQLENPPIYVYDHETEEINLEAEDLQSFLEKYNNYEPQKKKWYSFLFS